MPRKRRIPRRTGSSSSRNQLLERIAVASGSQQIRSTPKLHVRRIIRFADELAELHGHQLMSIMQDGWNQSEFKLDLDGFYENGWVVGTILDNGIQHRAFINCTEAEPKCGCSCEVSQGIRFCCHTLLLCLTIGSELKTYVSELSQQLRIGSLLPGQPDMDQFQFNPHAIVAAMLDQVLESAQIRSSVEDETSLAGIQHKPIQRIAWNLTISSGRPLTLIPYLQPIKKRGDGWNKGRQIDLRSLKRLCGDRTTLSQADHRICDLIEVDEYAYYDQHKLDIVSALEQLIGEPNVMVNFMPVTVARSDLVLELRRTDKLCRFSLLGTASESAFFGSAHGMIQVREDIGLVQFCKADNAQAELMQQLGKLPWLPLELEHVLLEHARKLQNVVGCILPESVAGEVLNDSSRPVMLLRSRNDGSLDCGIRLRTLLGSVVKPACGRMVLHGKIDGRDVQLRRFGVQEEATAKQLAERFALDSYDQETSIRDFEKALELIEKLQSAEDAGELEVLWDKTSEPPLRVLGSVSRKNVSVGVSSKRDWFQLSGSCNFGSESVDLSELLSRLQSTNSDDLRGEFVRLGDRGWAKVSKEIRQQFAQIHDSVNHERGQLKFDATSAPAIRQLLAEQELSTASKAWTSCLERLDRAEKLNPVLPGELQADLRAYQHEGFQWLRRLAEWGVGAILADDMGLGKTLQTLAVLLDRSSLGPTLVIAPTSVGFNWVREANRFAPSLETTMYRETDRADFLGGVGPGSLVICSYGLALRDADALSKVQWNTLVLDEAQAIKNSRSKTSSAIAKIPADWKLALTGTPIENHLGELWSLFHVVSPGVLGGWDQFRRRFASPIEKDNDEDRRIALRDRLRPFILRRTKVEVLKDLPPRTESNVYVELTPAEREIYNRVRVSALGEMEELAKLPDIKDSRFRILALLTRMRQLACSPKLVHEEWSDRSSKLQQLCQTLHELRAEGHRVLVFSQFVKHLDLIRQMLDEELISYEYLDGSTEASLRQKRVDSFQNGDATVFLISLKAGGTGLNLTAADYVIHMDPWWNPAVEDQATDRAHRIGQDKPVMVYRLVSQGTIEEEILKLHDTKRDLVAGILEGSQAAAKLSTEDLINLLRKG